MISLLIRSELMARRPIVDRRESVRSLDGMGRRDHRSDCEALFPHFLGTALHALSARLASRHFFEELSVGIVHLFQQHGCRPQDPFQLRFLTGQKTPRRIAASDLTHIAAMAARSLLAGAQYAGAIWTR